MRDDITAVIFSRNRAMQLDLLLRSMEKYARDLFTSAIILYRADSGPFDEAYQKLEAEHEEHTNIYWWREGKSERNFDQDLTAILNGGMIDTPYICFFCDDDVFYRPAHVVWPEYSAVGFSFRLGQNTTWNYMENREQKPGEGDFAYWFSLDGTVYAVDDARKWIKAGRPFGPKQINAGLAPLRNPNDLEARINVLSAPGPLAYLDHSCLVSIPHNRVTEWPQMNRHGQRINHSPEWLNHLFLTGWRIDLERIDFSGVRGCHQEIQYEFKGEKRPTAKEEETASAPLARPIFSILHPTARLPEGWIPAYEQAKRNAQCWQDVEYILCVDNRDADDPKKQPPYETLKNMRVVVNNDRPCSVAAYNAAAKQASGKILIHAQDDVFFPKDWDADLLNTIPSWVEHRIIDEVVIHVSSDSPRDDFQMAPQIYSRARYEKLGYAFYPEYLGMYADNEFTEHAYHDGVVIQARHLVFEQRHPAFGKAEWDEVYMHENSAESYSLGFEILKRRRRELGLSISELPRQTDVLAPIAPREVIGKANYGEWEHLREAAHSPRKAILCLLPGETFSRTWVAAWTKLHSTLLRHYSVGDNWNYISGDCHAMRSDFVIGLDAGLDQGVTFDFVLWLDDDNVVSFEQVQMLIEDLEAYPELAGIGGWCWTQIDGGERGEGSKISCGELDEKGHCVPFTYDQMAEAHSKRGFPSIDYSGLPCFLMRASVLRGMGMQAWGPLLAPWIRYGKYGEDVGWFIRAAYGDPKVQLATREMFPLPKERAHRFAVDPRVRVKHIKGSDAGPEGKPWPPLDSSGSQIEVSWPTADEVRAMNAL